jgi:hypothetical protein
MSGPTLDPAPPFVWPDPRVLAGFHGYQHATPIQPLLERARAAAGIVSGVDEAGARWLAELIRTRSLGCRLIFNVWPACPTGRDVLHDLAELQTAFRSQPSVTPGRTPVEFRLLAADQVVESPPNALCVVDPDARVWLATGSAFNFGLGAGPFAGFNVVLAAEPMLGDAWRRWFDWMWWDSAPMTHETVAIPRLIPARGTTEAADAWQAYLTRCRQARAGSDGPGDAKVAVDSDSGEVTSTGPAGTANPSPADAIGLPKSDPLLERIARIYERGALATIDKSTRIPPLDVPIKAEVFDTTGHRRVGSGARSLGYSFTILDTSDGRKLDRIRRSAGELLTRFSFQLAEGVRWMPLAARPLFEAELERASERGRTRLEEVVGSDVDAFVKGRRDQVRQAASEFYRELHPGQDVPESIVDEILRQGTARLKAAVSGSFLPRVTPARIRFDVGEDSTWISRWGQAATLLNEVAAFPRRILTDRFFLQGLDAHENKLLEAMDVCGDSIVQAMGTRGVKDRARGELEVLGRLSRSGLDARRRCELLLALMAGDDVEDQISQEPDAN